MPVVEVVDLKTEFKDSLRGSKESRLLLGRTLRDALAETIIRKEQAMVFVNRKGFSSFVMCGECGEVPKCLNCSVSMTYYQRAREMRCHYCGLKLPAVEQVRQMRMLRHQAHGHGHRADRRRGETPFSERRR